MCSLVLDSPNFDQIAKRISIYGNAGCLVINLVVLRRMNFSDPVDILKALLGILISSHNKKWK